MPTESQMTPPAPALPFHPPPPPTHSPPSRQDLSLMPAVHRRVRLAVRLDEVERTTSKDKADRTWRQQHAEELGIELSDEDDSDGEAGDRPAGGLDAARLFQQCEFGCAFLMRDVFLGCGMGFIPTDTAWLLCVFAACACCRGASRTAARQARQA